MNCKYQDYFEKCEGCPHNQGQQNNLPCGQQQCWYSCSVCRYNNLQTCEQLYKQKVLS